MNWIKGETNEVHFRHVKKIYIYYNPTSVSHIVDKSMSHSPKDEWHLHYIHFIHVDVIREWQRMHYTDYLFVPFVYMSDWFTCTTVCVFSLSYMCILRSVYIWVVCALCCLLTCMYAKYFVFTRASSVCFIYAIYGYFMLELQCLMIYLLHPSFILVRGDGL